MPTNLAKWQYWFWCDLCGRECIRHCNARKCPVCKVGNLCKLCKATNGEIDRCFAKTAAELERLKAKVKMPTDQWTATADALPTRGEIVETKIDDEKGCRNAQQLKRGAGRLWFFPDDSMYVYYEPTHWRRIEVNDAH